MQPAIPDTAVDIAIIGAGQRSSSIYRPLMASLEPWVRVCAVCDPVEDHARHLAEALDAPCFADIRRMLDTLRLEAAFVIAPVESHHSISCFLSSRGIHHLVETTFASSLTQAREMVGAARDAGVTLRVAENFLRFPIDRIVNLIRDAGDVGPIHRIVSYDDHTGYHNNSRWIAFAGGHPVAAQSIEHTMPTTAFNSSPERYHDHETYRARFYWFPGNLLVVDHAANAKGFLGRYPRPGYTEWQGERGTIACFARTPWQGEGEVRLCPPDTDEPRGIADVVCPIHMEYDDRRRWTSTWVDLPSGRVEHTNPFRPDELPPHVNDWYGSAIMDHVVDFALAVRGLRESEFDDGDALMSMEMEVAARDSAGDAGRRISLPVEGPVRTDEANHADLRERLGVDPLAVDAMLGASFPKP